MNSVVEILHELRALRINLSAIGNELICEAPPGVLTPELRARMTANKPAILRLLAQTNVAEPREGGVHGIAQLASNLSHTQRSIWLLEQIQPGTCTWNVSWALDVRGEIDRDALQRALRALLQRHAVLRSRFRNVSGVPVVDFPPLDDWQIDFKDLRGLPDAEDRAVALATAEVQRPFDLERGPPLRVQLSQTGATTYLLLLVVHHIVADGWSLGLIGAELDRLYRASLSGRGNDLPPLHADFQTAADWMRSEEEFTRPDLEWWREKLSGSLPILSLADDIARPSSGAGRRVSIEVGEELRSRIEVLAHAHKSTPFMVLLAAFQLLIHRYTGSTDILVGTHVSGRDRSEFTDVIGMFVNTLVLRTSVEPSLTGRELLARVRETSLQAFARQRVAFDRVVEAVKPKRIAGHNPLVRHAFAYQNLPFCAFQLGAAEVRHRPLELAGSRYELSVEVWRTSSGLSCDFEYATDLFDAETIKRMMGHYLRLLEGMVAAPDCPIFELPLLADAERDQLLNALSGENTEYPLDRRLEELFSEQAAKAPEAPALIYRGHELSYRELDRRANQLAHYLRSLQVGPHVLVGVCLDRSPDLVVAILAILKAGGAYVPLDPKYPVQRLAYMVEDSAAAVVITHSTLRELLPNGALVVELDRVEALVVEEPGTAPVTQANTGDLAYVMYTSGSTGRPKGTMLGHSARFLIDWARRTFTREELSRVVAATSICFDLSVFELFVPLCTGGAIVLVADPLDPPDPMSRPTLLNTVPSALAELARKRMIPDTVRIIIACGEKLNNLVVQGLYDATTSARIYNLYGPTEYTTYATAALTVRGAERDPPIGRPLCNTRVYILDAQRQLLPAGRIGEMFIAGHGLARGYLGQPELTAERFVENPFGASGERMYRTGDLARWSSDGQLEFVGRVDHQVKLRGYRIELGEIEATLRRHPGVRDAVALTRDEDANGPQLIAYLIADGEPPSSDELRQHLKGWLPEYMIPSLLVFLPKFPLTPSGKIDRAALPSPDDYRVTLMAKAPWTGWIQEMIADTFMQVLHVDQFGVYNNFFDMGGHSLKAVEAASQLEDLLAQPVSPALIFQAPTPHELGPLIEATAVTPSTHITTLQPFGDRPALFCCHNLFSRPFDYTSLARALAPDQPVYGVVPGPLEKAFIANPTFDLLTPAYVSAIKAIQPNGPYRVVGFSFGGLVAFDVAQALLAKGDDVLLIMIDPYIFGAMPTTGQIVRWASLRGRKALGDIWTANKAVVPKLIETEQWVRRQGQRIIRKFHKTLRDSKMSLDVVAASRVPDWISPIGRPLAAALLHAEATYKYRPYKGPAVFIQGTIRDAMLDLLNTDGLNGWSGLFDGALTTQFELTAHHVWMMRNPFVSEVAKVLREL